MATKTKQPEVVVEEIVVESKDDTKPFVETLHKILLASIGAVALAQEEIEDFVNKLVERGELAEKDGRKLVHEVMDRRKKDAEKAEDQLTRRVEDILGRMNVPTKSDIDALGEKVAALTNKVESLKKS
ncbi:MAG: phasin family protein [Anaerolineales bacterium]|jgi:poly(hydroxyalkanoate) granule-associated protein|nr:phasin family protein [Anaerolineales bacterium]